MNRSAFFVAALLLGCNTLWGQAFKGILIESKFFPVVVFLNGEQVCSPVNTCFMTPLKRGIYQVDIFTAPEEGSVRPVGKLLYSRKVEYKNKSINIPISAIQPDGTPVKIAGKNGDIMLPTYSEVQINLLTKSIREATYDKDKHLVLDKALGATFFYTNQIGRLIDEFGYQSEKLEALKKLYPYTIDRENFYPVLSEKLKYTDDKNELNRFILTFSDENSPFKIK